MPPTDEDLGGLTSVASFFVSRVDTKADPALASNSPLRGRIAVANAKRAYDRYLLRFSGPRWERLEALGAKPQRPLWASTGTKNPDYSDVLYVEQLIAPGVINTMPDATLRAFRDHGRDRVDPRRRRRRSRDRSGCGRVRGARPRRDHRPSSSAKASSPSAAPIASSCDCIETKLAAISGHAAIRA